MSKRIRKAVFPVGGLGTRFLPATKAMPKEMLPVVDKPLIQYAVEEAREAGIDHLVFVTGRGKQAIEDHFDHSGELEKLLAEKGKDDILISATSMMGERPGQIAYTRQQEPKGLGHAVWCARNLVGNEPFAVLLADDLIKGNVGCLKQMVDAYEKVGGNLIAAMEVPNEHTSRYGILSPGSTKDNLIEVTGLVEKPAIEDAPSNQAVIGRYILQPEIFEYLASQETGAGGEIQLTDAMARMIGEVPFHGVVFDGHRYDCGDKFGFLQANIAYALDRPEMQQDMQNYIQELAARA